MECLFLDLRFFLFEQKVKHIKAYADVNGGYDQARAEALAEDFEFTTYDLSELINEIVTKTEGDIRK